MVIYQVGFSVKKVIALLFLLIAKTIMLAHVIIPHHCHNGLIFTTIIAHNAHDCDTLNDHQCNHALSNGKCDYTNCNNDFDNCVSATIYIKSCNCRNTYLLHDCNFELSHLALFSDNSLPPIVDDVGLPFRQNPLTTSYLTEYISQSLGLRAPPVC